MNLIELLDESAAAWPQKPAFIEGESLVTYSALATRVRELADALSGLSLPPGSRVGVHFPNGVDYVVLTFALWKLHPDWLAVAWPDVFAWFEGGGHLAWRTDPAWAACGAGDRPTGP